MSPRPPRRPTRAQLEHVARQVDRQMAYLDRLAARLLARGYTGEEPLAVIVRRARAAHHNLRIELDAEVRAVE